VTGFYANGQYGTIRSSSSDIEIFGTYARTGTWAPHTNSLLCDFFRRAGSGTYLDVGANIGLTTIPIAKQASVKCIAFEPEPINFENLQINISASCLSGNVEIRQVAVYDRSSMMDFEIAPDNLGDHRLRSTSSPGRYDEERRQVIRVPTATLDDLAPDVRPPLAIKIDTQGAEPFVFNGGKRTLSKADLIIVEWWPYGMRRLNGNPSLVTEFLQKQFASVIIAEREDGEIGQPLRADEACSRLRAMAAEKRENAYFFVDVIAQRSQGS
jgi:FkbM family methyltransferase